MRARPHIRVLGRALIGVLAGVLFGVGVRALLTGELGIASDISNKYGLLAATIGVIYGGFWGAEMGRRQRRGLKKEDEISEHADSPLLVLFVVAGFSVGGGAGFVSHYPCSSGWHIPSTSLAG